MRIYIAGPYSSDPEGNTARAEAIAVELSQIGHAPHVPHWTGRLLKHDPTITYEKFMEIDFEWVRASEAVVRFSGHSPGADREVKLAESLGIPVYYYPWDMHKLKGSTNGTEAKGAKQNKGVAAKSAGKTVDRLVGATCWTGSGGR